MKSLLQQQVHGFTPASQDLIPSLEPFFIRLHFNKYCQLTLAGLPWLACPFPWVISFTHRMYIKRYHKNKVFKINNIYMYSLHPPPPKLMLTCLSQYNSSQRKSENWYGDVPAFYQYDVSGSAVVFKLHYWRIKSSLQCSNDCLLHHHQRKTKPSVTQTRSQPSHRNKLKKVSYHWSTQTSCIENTHRSYSNHVSWLFLSSKNRKGASVRFYNAN